MHKSITVSSTTLIPDISNLNQPIPAGRVIWAFITLLHLPRPSEPFTG